MSRIASVTDLQAPNRSTSQSGDLREVEVDEFLQLMITELQNQDPLDPADNGEILQQITQIREIGATNLLTETLNTIQTGQNLTTASALIGKEVQALSDAAEEVTGIVERVTVEITGSGNTESRSLRVIVDGKSVSLNNIREVRSV